MIVKWFIQSLVKLSAYMNAVATLWTFLLVFFMTADVVGRIFFNHPLTGAPELVKISLVGLVYLHMANTLWVGRHIRSELLVNRMGARFKDVLEVIMYLLGAGLFIIIVTSNWDYMIRAWEIGEYEGEGALRVPTAPIRTILIVGSTLTALLYLVRTGESFGKLINRFKKET